MKTLNEMLNDTMNDIMDNSSYLIKRNYFLSIIERKKASGGFSVEIYYDPSNKNDVRVVKDLRSFGYKVKLTIRREFREGDVPIMKVSW